MDGHAEVSVPAEQQANGDGVGVETAAAPEQQQAQPSQVSDEEVKQRLLVLLGKSDLTQTTEKMLRKQLEKDLGQDLSSKKALIRQEVLTYLEQQQPAEEEEEAADEEEEQEEAPKAKKRGGGGGFGGVCHMSEALQAFTGQEQMKRTEIVKAIWDYIKANDLQNPKDKRKIIIDEKLGTLFTTPLTMFSINKQLTKHVISASQAAGNGDDDEGAPCKPRPAKRKKAASDDDDDDDAGEAKAAKRKPSGFAAPQPISEELAAAAGKEQMSRGEVMKWLYAYVKEHDLKDPSNGQFAISDETLLQLTGEKRFKLFGAQKLFGKHFLKKQ